MTINFSFTKTDDIVIQRLSQTERDAITTEQQSGSYTFEFHRKHGAGEPVYIRANKDKTKSNTPKIDTKDKTAGDYSTVRKIANGGKLTRHLNGQEVQEILNIVKNDWDRLQTLAHRHWNGIAAPQPAQAQGQAPANLTFGCKKPNCNGRIPLPSGYSDGKLMCPTCYGFYAPD